jgi:hypothetical protein
MKKWAHELCRDFSKEDFPMAKKHMKKCSPSLLINGNANQNHIKIPTCTFLKHNKNTNNNKC